MKDLNLKVFQMTKNAKVFEMKTKDLAKLIIEKILANKDGFVSDDFMNLMADHLHKLYNKNYNVWLLFSEIALQRISIATMQKYNIKHATWTQNYVVPHAFDMNANANNKGKIYNFTDMVKVPSDFNEACFNFITKQGSFILQNSSNNHIVDILFALINDRNDGIYQSIQISNDVDQNTLVDFALKNLYQKVPVSSVIKYISDKNIWFKHIPYIRKNWYYINHREFAKAIGINGHLLKLRLFIKIFL